MSGAPFRALRVFRGGPEQTEADARAFCGDADVVWSAARDGAGSALRDRLGQSVDAVVLDLHQGFDADQLGRSHGLIVAGGALVLRMPDAPVPSAALAVHPYGPEDVGIRTWTRLERAIATAGALLDAPFAPVRTFGATAEQDAVVERLAARFAAGPSARPARIALTADRGRGKSSALGRAASGRGAVVTASHPDQVAEVLRFAPDARYVDPLTLARTPTEAPVLLVDEAAGLSVPLLRAILEAHPHTPVAFASTVHGYEGHGRGFTLRFLPGVPDLERLVLETPIRWRADDPLERFVHGVLLLDAEPGIVPPSRGRGRPPPEARILDRDTLDGPRLSEVFGLLVAAHYRTTPSDLQRLLDAPNLTLHGLFEGDALVAVGLIAREGGLPADLAAALARGDRRIRGHALAETLAVHSGRPDAATLDIRRSVRTATHPDRRREGLARALVEHVHASSTPDLFGTLFGATAPLLAFRRAQGYRLVRLGVSRNSRTGEPSAVMVRPVSPAATALVQALRAGLARDLPLQLALMEGDGLVLEPDLREALHADLPAPAPLDDAAIAEALQAYARGPRPYDAVATAVTAWLDREAPDLGRLDPVERALVDGRIRERVPWAALAESLGLSVPAAMRALRRAVRTLTEPSGALRGPATG